MNALAQRPTAELVTADAASVMQIISRAASDPNTDMEKLERLLAMYERISERQAVQGFNEAMNAAQDELRPVAANADNPQTKSKYATYTALDNAIRPIYAKHGFSLSFDTGDGAPPEHVRVVCHVAHVGGYARTHHVDMPADGKGAKGGDVMTKTHATGAAMSYGQRYLLKMIFNIAVGTDRDGNLPPREPSSAAQVANAAINACNTVDELKAWKAKNGEGLSKLPTDDADAIVRLFNQRLRNLKEAAQ